MADIKKILFALDFEELTKKITPWVDLMTNQFNAELDVLHVIPEMDYWPVAYAIPPSILDDERVLIEKAEKRTERFCREHLQLNRSLYNIFVRIDDPVKGIIKHIEDHDISAVIIGTHGKKGMDRTIFGSVADRVLRLSPVPVFCITKPVLMPQ